jgi:predicted RNase H-like nuclease (RuvC/YqgF family)
VGAVVAAETFPGTGLPGLVSTASQPVPGNEQDALSVQRVRLLETELRDKDSVLEQEKREVQKLRQEILTMDAERQMFEKQLSNAEDAARAARAAGTRFRKLEDDAVQLERVVELLRKEKENEVSDMRRSLDNLQKAIDQQERWREQRGSSGRVSPSVEHAAKQKGTSSDEVGMWSGRYMNGR